MAFLVVLALLALLALLGSWFEPEVGLEWRSGANSRVRVGRKDEQVKFWSNVM